MLLIKDLSSNDDAKYTIDAPKTYHRLVSQPLDVDSVCMTSEEFIKYICRFDSTSYYGQVVSVNYDPTIDYITNTMYPPVAIPTMVVSNGFAKPLIDLNTVYDSITGKTYLLVYYASKNHISVAGLTDPLVCLSGSTTYYSIFPLIDLFADRNFKLQFRICTGYDTYRNPTHIFEQNMFSVFDGDKYDYGANLKKGLISQLIRNTDSSRFGAMIMPFNPQSGGIISDVGASILPFESMPVDDRKEIKIYLDITDYMMGIEGGLTRDAYGGFEQWLERVQK